MARRREAGGHSEGARVSFGVTKVAENSTTHALLAKEAAAAAPPLHSLSLSLSVSQAF